MLKLSIVIPVFNEEDVLPEALKRLSALRGSFPPDVDLEYMFIDDGSKDASLSLLEEAAAHDRAVKVLSFSRNFGHQMAITAGLDMAEGDYVAVIDADLQDPPELIVEMLDLARREGFDVVYGKRSAREGETRFKKLTAAVFYRVLKYMCEIDIPEDTGDFRLMSRRIVNHFKCFRERHRFVRGLVPWLGFSQKPLEYVRQKRSAGLTKYPFRKMLAFAVNAVLSFSNKPLTLATRLGFAALVVAVVGSLVMLWLKIFTAFTVPGLASSIIAMAFFSGIQLLLMGLMGEYIARIFEEIKQRPLYIIGRSFNCSSNMPAERHWPDSRSCP